MGIIWLMAILSGGAALGAQAASNGALAKHIGVLEAALLTFMTGSMVLFLLVLFFGSGQFWGILTAPKWQLSAAFLGVLFLASAVFLVPKIGVVSTGIAMVAGQLISAMVIDHFAWFDAVHMPLDGGRVLAILALLMAMVFIGKSNQKQGKTFDVVLNHNEAKCDLTNDQKSAKIRMIRLTWR